MRGYHAAALSLLMPGAGQLLLGRVGRGLYFFVLMVFMWAISFGLLGWLIHLLAALDALHCGVTPIASSDHTEVEPQVHNWNHRSTPTPSNVIPFPTRGR